MISVDSALLEFYDLAFGVRAHLTLEAPQVAVIDERTVTLDSRQRGDVSVMRVR